MAKKKTTKKKSSARSSKLPDTTGKQLVIVESPAKAKTINKYLGNQYVVTASVGHIRDLPSRNPKGVKNPVPGVDLENNFAPTYEVIKGKGTAITELKRAAKKADGIWLATDLDREGEAIAWHLAEALNAPDDKTRRVVFNAITKDDIRAAFDRPHHLDMGKVNAQQARRILDRIVGYQVSPLLWKKVAGGLSAGRVQSVAVRLIVEREREIEAFIPSEHWTISSAFTLNLPRAGELGPAYQQWLDDAPPRKDKKDIGRTIKEKNGWLAAHESFPAELIELDGHRFMPMNEDDAMKAANAMNFIIDDRQQVNDPKAKGPAQNKVTLRGHLGEPFPWAIKSITTKRTKSRPYPPYITSTLQVAAANVLGFSASNTMRLAQQLYEGIEIKGQGSVGLITYMRTDSVNLSNLAIDMARDFIVSEYGERYMIDKARRFSSSNKDAQEAHEAIRPTDVTLTPKKIKSSLSDQQYKLYKLIWERFVGCQMPDAEWDATTIMIEGQGNGHSLGFKANGRILVFDGFYKAVGVPNQSDEVTLPPLQEGQDVAPFYLDPKQRFNSPPARYTEASLVKKLESEGIGRPSTYASIIQVIQNRKYVEKLSNRFHATDLGMVVTDKLIEGFPDIMDVGYTRDMEAQLDHIEDDAHGWTNMLHRFYGPFAKSLESAQESMTHAKAEMEPAPHTCPNCGAGTVYRFGKNGRFLSCATYQDKNSECKWAAPIDREGNPVEPTATEVACPKCSSPMLLRKGRFGPFLSCSNYPACDGILNLDKKGNVTPPKVPPYLTDLACPKCDSKMNLRRGARGPWLGCSNFPKCRGRIGWNSLEDAEKDKLEKALDAHEKEHPQPVIKKLDGTPIGDNYQPHAAGENTEE